MIDGKSFEAIAQAKAKKASADLYKMARVRGFIPVTNATATGSYTGHELTAPAVRPGADDHFQCPSRRADGLYYRDGRVEAA